MKADKIFFASWGLVIIMAGVCAIIGLSFQWDFWSIVMLWLFSVGMILIVAGIISIPADRKTAILQIMAGELLATITLGILAIHLRLLDMYIIFALIIIIVGGSVIAIGVSRKE
jgi:hypothetical protein